MEMKKSELTHGSLFSGIEGFGLGAALAGIKTEWSCEFEDYQSLVCTIPYQNIEIIQLGSSIDWEQRRYELAKAAMQGILSNEEEVGYACSGATYKENEKHTVPKAVAQFAIACADVLINELKGK